MPRKIARRVLRFRERQRRGGIMRPSTFAAIEREAAARGARDPAAVAGAAYWKTLAARRGSAPLNPSILDEIRHGDKVTILMPSVLGREGQEYAPRTGTAVMRGPHGWVLNLGGRFGTPAVATETNIVRVRKVNPSKRPKLRKGESAPEYHARRVQEIVAKMPKPIREVFDRNPAEYRFIFRNAADGVEGAAALYETFHGRAPREILELTESAEERGEYAGLGDLVELTIVAPTRDAVQIQFKGDGVRLAANPEGTQLYLLGGNQDISGHLGLFGADESKDLIDLGELKQLVYEAVKWQTDFTPQEWKHDLGEESGVRPQAFYDQLKKRIFFAGGNYRVTRPGIVD